MGTDTTSASILDQAKALADQAGDATVQLEKERADLIAERNAKLDAARDKIRGEYAPKIEALEDGLKLMSRLTNAVNPVERAPRTQQAHTGRKVYVSEGVLAEVVAAFRDGPLTAKEAIPASGRSEPTVRNAISVARERSLLRLKVAGTGRASAVYAITPTGEEYLDAQAAMTNGNGDH